MGGWMVGWLLAMALRAHLAHSIMGNMNLKYAMVFLRVVSLPNSSESKGIVLQPRGIDVVWCHQNNGIKFIIGCFSKYFFWEFSGNNNGSVVI